MNYRQMGATGLRISEISIGGWITFGGTIDDATSADVVREAVECGINFIDLADVYEYGKAELAFGRVLPEFRRADLVISSKVFGKMSDNTNDRGLSRKHIFESVERSLKNIGTDYLDIYFCHREDPETPLEETVRAMDDLVHQGKVLYWGTSVWPEDWLRNGHAIAERCNLYAPMVEQPPYSLMDRGIEADVLPAAAELGMGVVVWSPLKGGVLTGKYNDGVPEKSRAAQTGWLNDVLTEENLDRVRRFCGIAQELSVEPGQLALAWALRRPEVSSVITGASSPAHVRSNVGALEIAMTEELTSTLDELFPA